MCRVNARQPSKANLHDLEWRHLVVERPFIVAAVNGKDSSFVVRFDFNIGEWKKSLFPAIERSNHEVAVV